MPFPALRICGTWAHTRLLPVTHCVRICAAFSSREDAEMGASLCKLCCIVYNRDTQYNKSIRSTHTHAHSFNKHPHPHTHPHTLRRNLALQQHKHNTSQQSLHLSPVTSNSRKCTQTHKYTSRANRRPSKSDLRAVTAAAHSPTRSDQSAASHLHLNKHHNNTCQNRCALWVLKHAKCGQMT